MTVVQTAYNRVYGTMRDGADIRPATMEHRYLHFFIADAAETGQVQRHIRVTVKIQRCSTLDRRG